MQLFEALAWRTQKNKNSRLHFWATQGALISNVMQPIVVGLLCLALINGSSTTNKVLAITLMAAYIGWLIYAVNNTENFKTLTPLEGCDHLNLGWWKSFGDTIKPLHGALPYMICLFGVMFLLLRPLDLMYVSAFVIATTLLISYYLYNCGTGSMWCWLVASAPVIIGAYFYNTRYVK